MRPEVVANLIKTLVVFYLMESPLGDYQPDNKSLACKILRVFDIELDNSTNTIEYHASDTEVYKVSVDRVFSVFCSDRKIRITPYRMSTLDSESVEGLLNKYSSHAKAMSPLLEAIGYFINCDGDTYRLTYIGNPIDVNYLDFLETDERHWKDIIGPDGIDYREYEKNLKEGYRPAWFVNKETIDVQR